MGADSRLLQGRQAFKDKGRTDLIWIISPSLVSPASDATTLSSLGMQEPTGICQNWSLENIDLQGRKVSRLQGKVLIDCIKAQQELGLKKTKVSLCLPYPDEATSF